MAVMLLVLVVGSLLLSCTQSTEEERFGAAVLNPIVTIDQSVKFPDGSVAFSLSEDISVSDCSFRLSNLNGQYSATWASVDEYPRAEPLLPGGYTAEVFYGAMEREGFDNPCIYGAAAVELANGENRSLPIACSISNAVLSIDYSLIESSIISEIDVVIHTSGGGFISYPMAETRKAFIHPGDVDIHVSLTMDTGEKADFKAVSIPDVKAATLYRVIFDTKIADDGVAELLISFDESIAADDVTIRLTPEFLSAEAPIVAPIGFEPNETITIVEGMGPETDLGFDIVGGNLSSLMLSVVSPELQSKGWPKQIDLVATSESELAALKSLGLKISGEGKNITRIDVTEVIAQMKSSETTQLISLLAVGEHGKISEPMVLNVNVSPVEIAVVGASEMHVGDVEVEVLLSSNSQLSAEVLSVEMLSGRSSLDWIPVEIQSINPDFEDPNKKIVRLKMPTVRAGEIDLRFLYSGKEVAKTVLKVDSPDYSFEVDAFAKLIYLKVQAETPQLESLITSMVNIYVNGSIVQSLMRDPDSGTIIVGGFAENTLYQLSATLYEHPSEAEHFTAPVAIKTEVCEPLPNGSFEDVETGLGYKNLPAGGRYSQNIVEIYNQQNYVSYDLYMPKHWATVNAKTFCTGASNHNTWYMQPSTATIKDVMEGAFAVELVSTSWDLNGEQIPDYRQTGLPYTNYNKNVPNMANRAAGRLFLGEYRFNPLTMTEEYIEGIMFASRPASLNGYYKFVPCVDDLSDCGVVTVEVMGCVNDSEVVIARARQELPGVVGYTAFSVPLSYKMFGVKATAIKVMFASSKHYGSIEEETESIITYSDVVTSTSHGGRLSIDNLTFSY